MTERVLVTGGAGFIGSHLVADLIRDGHEVVVADRVPRERAFRLRSSVDSRTLVYVQVDLLEDPGRALGHALDGVGVVFHLAGNTENRSENAAVHADLDATVRGTVEVLDNLVSRAPGARLVQTSSQLVYRPRPDRPSTEESELGPRSLFGAGKMAAEAFSHAYAHEFGLSVALCRLGNIVGGDFPRGIIYDMVQRVTEDTDVLRVLGDGTQRRGYLRVDDCVAALRRAADHGREPSSSEVLNVANTDQISALDVARLVGEESTGPAPPVESSATPGGWRGDTGTVTTHPVRLLDAGWRPRHDSEEAVRLTAREMFRALEGGDR